MGCIPIEPGVIKKLSWGTSPVVHWLRLCASSAGGTGSISGWGTNIPYALWPKKNFFFNVCWKFCLGIRFGFPLDKTHWASQVAIVVKNPPANAGDARDSGLIPGLRRSPGGGNGNPLQYSCLENSLDRGAWRATVHGLQRVVHD